MPLQGTYLPLHLKLTKCKLANEGCQFFLEILPKNFCPGTYVLAKGVYDLRAKTDSGVLKCQAVKGFDIPVRALFDEKDNLDALKAVLTG